MIALVFLLSFVVARPVKPSWTELRSSGCDKPRAKTNRVFVQNLDLNGKPRQYSVFLDSSTDNTVAHPVVMQMHGGGSVQPLDFDSKSQWRKKSKDFGTGFVVITGVSGMDAGGGFRMWNSREDPAMENDIEYIEKVLDEVESMYCVDRTMVYLTGLSSGAHMAYRAAFNAKLSARITAVAPIVGVVGSLAIPAGTCSQKCRTDRDGRKGDTSRCIFGNGCTDIQAYCWDPTESVGCDQPFYPDYPGNQPIPGVAYSESFYPDQMQRAVPVLAINGALDENVPFDGGRGTATQAPSGGVMPPQKYVARLLGALPKYGCQKEYAWPVSTKISTSKPGVTHYQWTNPGRCYPTGLQSVGWYEPKDLISVIELADNGHRWPGGAGDSAGDQPQSTTYDATTETAKFFLTHRIDPTFIDPNWKSAAVNGDAGVGGDSGNGAEMLTDVKMSSAASMAPLTSLIIGVTMSRMD